MGKVLGDDLQGKTLNITLIRQIHHIKSFKDLITDELKVLHFGIIYGDGNKEKRWISQQKPQLIVK